MIDDEILEAIDYFLDECGGYQYKGEDFCRGIQAVKEMLMDYDGLAWPDMTEDEKMTFVRAYR